MSSGLPMAVVRASALEAAGLVGTWTTDTTVGRSVLEREAAALLSGDPNLAGQPLPLEVALGRIHPVDRDWVFARIRRSRVEGGPFSAEFRVLDGAGGVRWILNRGAGIPGEGGTLRGGVYLDTTDSHRDPLFPAVERAIPGDPLDTAAEHCVRAHAAVSRSGRSSLLLMVDLLLMEIGRALAGRRGP